jgi:undecaprenyl-diphosphatase
MFEWLEGIDRSIVLTINGMHSPAFDYFFTVVSGKLTWIPLYLWLVFLIQRSFGWKKTGIFLLFMLVCITLVDTGSVYLFKEVFQRYRPSHHTYLGSKLHLQLDGKGNRILGGDFGFISSHAANFAAISGLVGLTLRKYYPQLIWWLFGVTALVCYSRIYLGMHYLSDVFVGALWGITISWLIYHFLVRRFILPDTRN